METKPEEVEYHSLTTESTEAVAEASIQTETKGEATPKATDPAPPADVPDPDEDDLDDLDDMLDEFTPSNPEPKAPSIPSGPGRPQPDAPATEEGLSDDDFAKQLQAGMADLIGDLENSPDMQAQFENMMRELSGAAVTGEPAASSTTPPAVSTPNPGASTDKPAAAAAVDAAEESFQATIQKTMERMRLSGDNATAAAASSDTDDILAEMMKAMQGTGLDAEGSEEDFSKMILGMMEQLTNKEILYEPMKELHDKFPDWLEKNAVTTGAEDLKRYREQQVYVREIVGKFEERTYKDENAADREYIVERMQKMQAAGAPPPDLVGDMAAAQEAFGGGGGPEEGCPQQ